VTIHGDARYRVSEDEVCEAVVRLAELDSCTPSDSNATVVLALFRVVVPTPSAIPAKIAALSGSVVAGSFVAAVAGPASGTGAMQRALTELHIAQCGGLSGQPLLLAESILQLRVGSDALSYRRGAVVGNVAFWAALAAAAAALVQLRARGMLRCGGGAIGVAEAAAEMRLPAMLVVGYVPLLQPTLTSAVTLCVMSSRAADVVIGLLGAAVCAAPIALLVVPLVLRMPFGAVAVAAEPRANEGVVCHRLLVRLVSRRHCWCDRVNGSRFVRHYGAVFKEFVEGRQWFILLDLSVEALCGVLGALVDLPQQQDSGCAGLKIAMVVVTAGNAAAVAVLRPSNTPVSTVMVSINAAMGFAAAVAVLLSPSVGEELAFAQGIAAVSSTALPVAALVLSGRARQRLRSLLVSSSDEELTVPPEWSLGDDSPQQLLIGAAGADTVDVDGDASLGCLLCAGDKEQTASESPRVDGIVREASILPPETDVCVSSGLFEPASLTFASELELLYQSLGPIASVPLAR
jgi:hypothetical protein